MLKIQKPVIRYKILSNDTIRLQNVKIIDGSRVTVIMRQVTPDDLTNIESWQGQSSITARQVDERTLSLLITQWGDRDSIKAIELARIPVETRGVLLEVFQQFCMPVYELVEETDETAETQKPVSVKQ